MEQMENFNIEIDINDILRGEGVNQEVVRATKPAMEKAAESALHVGYPLLHPQAVINTLNISKHYHDTILLENNQRLSGNLVSRHLGGAIQIAAVVCTIGEELDKKIKENTVSNALLALALDGVGNAAVEQLGQEVCRRIGENAHSIGMTTSTPLSPGEPEWPVEIGQPQIFALIDLSKIQVTITSGGMMMPKKSISFVVGIGPEMSQTDPCHLCNLRERCRYRHA